jgi:hypothetical protein
VSDYEENSDHPSVWEEHWRDAEGKFCARQRVEGALYQYAGKAKFAFSTQEDLKKWFVPPELESLDRMGFHPIEIEGRLMFRGKKQVIIMPKEE